ncbi:MAG: threonine ammonia-lyase, biosynthetic [Gammaproteobacteria bacterium]|nr:threonine ammonia-lyase, biosynthetic [Gammaproteobacteria bacterium]
MTDRYIKKILSARVYDVASESPLEYAPNLSRKLSNRVLLKREDQQQVFSFKLRGAYNKMYQLSQQGDLVGVIAASAGNHAQGVALAAKKLGVKAIIVMPRTTPAIKVEAVKALGAKAILHGDAYDDAYAHARELEQEKGYPFIHPYDDEDVIAGQGTVGLEICRQHPDRVDALFVPIGGGGLIAGVAVLMNYLRPEVKIIGVEPDDANSMQLALAKKRRVVLDQVGIFADGVAVKQAGKAPYDLCKKYVDEVITVSVDEMCAGIKEIFNETRTVTEPAGALAVAGLKKYVEREGVTGQTLIAINSGANINFDRLRHVAERAELGEQREMLLAVTLAEKAGSFRTFCQALGRRGVVTEFNYRYGDEQQAKIYAGVKIAGESERGELLAHLTEAGYEVLDLSDNEMAKTHIRYMVGGRAQMVRDERLFRFEFPERPGALPAFLNQVGKGWNISLFHYRNHGSAFGRVLCGIQVPDQEYERFLSHLEKLGFAYWNESDNPAYRAFLL